MKKTKLGVLALMMIVMVSGLTGCGSKDKELKNLKNMQEGRSLSIEQLNDSLPPFGDGELPSYAQRISVVERDKYGSEISREEYWVASGVETKYLNRYGYKDPNDVPVPYWYMSKIKFQRDGFVDYADSDVSGEDIQDPFLESKYFIAYADGTYQSRENKGIESLFPKTYDNIQDVPIPDWYLFPEEPDDDKHIIIPLSAFEGYCY